MHIFFQVLTCSFKLQNGNEFWLINIKFKTHFMMLSKSGLIRALLWWCCLWSLFGYWNYIQGSPLELSSVYCNYNNNEFHYIFSFWFAILGWLEIQYLTRERTEDANFSWIRATLCYIINLQPIRHVFVVKPGTPISPLIFCDIRAK